MSHTFAVRPTGEREGAPRARMLPGTVFVGHHGPPLVFRLLRAGRPPLRLEDAGQVLAIWRRALQARSVQPVPEIISGHPPGSTRAAPRPSARAHLALLPWPQADGTGRLMLGGVAASLPRSTSAEDRRLANHALAVVRRLTLGSLGVWDLEPVAREDGAQSGKGPSRIWTTLTPFVFGRYPRDPWGAKAQTMVTEACGIAGLPEPVRVETGRQAWLPGVPPASGFPPLWHRPGRPRSFHVHVRLEFAEPVEGPVLVGAGRHGGYGVFADYDRRVIP